MENCPLKIICRFCLIKCDTFERIEAYTKDILLLNINLNVSENPMMCINCAEIISKCFVFKSRCLDTFNHVRSFVDDISDTKLNLKDVYLSKREGLVYNLEDHCVCGFCMGLVKNCSAVSVDNEGDHKLLEIMLEKCLPEMDLNIIMKPMICPSCHDDLKEYFNFMTDCLMVEEKINKYCKTVNIISKEGLINLTNVLQFTRNALISEEGDNIADVIKEEKFCVDQGHVEEKNVNFMEVDQKWNRTLLTSKNVLICEEQNKRVGMIKSEGEMYVEHTDEVAQKTENFVEMEEQPFLVKEEIEIKTDQEDFDSLQDDGGQDRTTGIIMLKYQCKSCPYQTKYGYDLKRHTLVHKNPSEVTMHQCETCSFQTKFKRNLLTHMLVHKNTSEVIMYKCESCQFKTKYRDYLRRHNILVHKLSSETTMYQCETCSFQTKYKNALKNHLLLHKDPSEVTMYQCKSCPYQTKNKRNLPTHEFSHKHSSEVTMYQCDTCSYQSRYRQVLKNHLLVHLDPSQLTMYQCESCSFQTKHQNYIKRHEKSHKE